MGGILQAWSVALGSLVLGASVAGQAPLQLWIQQFGTSVDEWARALAPDAAGGAYVAGSTWGSMAAPNAGIRDVFLARYDNAGSQLWVVQFGTTGVDDAYALAPDGSGGAYVAGWTEGDLGGANAGPTDAWLARYDGAGNRTWIRQFGTIAGDGAAALTPDGAGGVYVAGQTSGDLGAPQVGNGDAWLGRFDAEGNQVWTIRQFGTAEADNAVALAPDGAGGVYVAGQTHGLLGSANAGNGDAFLARYDAAGAQTWIRQFGSSSGDEARAVASDGEGGVFVSGVTTGGLGATNAGLWDAFLARYDLAGTQLWLKQFGTPGGDRADALAPDGQGGVFVGVGTAGSLGGPHAGDNDAALAHFDNAGIQNWGLQIGTPAWDSPNALAPDGTGGVYMAGDTFGVLSSQSAGGRDAWLARYADACYPDCNADGSLTVADFGCFQTKFVLADPYGDCNADGQHTVADFGCFQTKFVVGCP